MNSMPNSPRVTSALVGVVRSLQELVSALGDQGAVAATPKVPVRRGRRPYIPASPVSETDRQAAKELLRRRGIMEVKP